MGRRQLTENTLGFHHLSNLLAHVVGAPNLQYVLVLNWKDEEERKDARIAKLKNHKSGRSSAFLHC